MSAKIREMNIRKCGSAKKYSDSLEKYGGKELLACSDANEYIKECILSGKPFLAARFGSTELLNIQTYEFGAHGKYGKEDRFKQLCDWSGFFPNDISLCGRFAETIEQACTFVDLIAVWYMPFEEYYIKKCMPENVKQTYLLDFEPWASECHWSAALKGKKVLVIHPFTETIRFQYNRRSELFPGTDILPDFELKTLKAVQTLAGTKDSRFENWFDALDWMYNEAMKIDFDIAIIGCGAYGLPLASKIKQAGKQAIHLAGATQILFGIKGKRWEEDPAFDYVRKWFNDSWIRPSDIDKIENSQKVEDSCYW